MRAGRDKKKAKKPSATERPKFAPAAFLSGTPEQVQSLCNDLAELAAERFSDLTGTTWVSVGQALASQLRELGHDLMSFEDTPEHQEWQTTWHHPKGTFVFTLEFRAPYAATVTWKTDDRTFTATR
ncbi:MAG: hypothetical protein ABUL60_35960 [Myxococcales bacterium]